MEIGILGPLEVTVSGTSVVPSARKPRQVLSLLIANMNSVTPIHVLMQEIWGENAPASASTTLQTYILQLRRLIGRALGADPAEAKKVLVTTAGGYSFRGPSETFDQYRFERLASRAHTELRLGHDGQMVRTSRQALALWRGSALVDVEHGLPLQAHVVRLEELRMQILEQCIDTELRLGRHHSLLSELSALTVEHRFNERVRTQLMLALYRSGRSAEALESFRQFRTDMIESIGMEPSGHLYRLHQAVLSADPGLDDRHLTTDGGQADLGLRRAVA